MTGVATAECEAGRSFGGTSSPSEEESAELRSLGQVENGIPSTSPLYWDNDNEDGGPKPSDLYGKYTWKIDKFSQINKRELRSSVFEIGGYKWYILIYPQGCDVCNHISLFLCVANHDKLLPGWSHFAQFTIAVVNKDSKKSKYSDTLHRFWKKEHDWGWKKFMELSKVLDGFIDDDSLTIKAQVQVIRERADRPFRCLDFQYRRELVRVYLTNVDQICRRTVEDCRCKLRKLIEDKARWSSFCAFWLGMDQNIRRHMSREKAECILKLVVKKFFIDKEVTSTLVLDSVYSGLKALESQKKEKFKGKYPDMEQPPNPLIHIEIDTFVLVDDLLLLIERAAMEPLPPKDEKGPQDRMKDGAAGEESSKDSIERDERQLTELGCRTIEIYALYHIYSKIEVAYQEAVALKRQEELIREEEAACFAEIDQKARRGLSDKEKKSRKKQAKQKKNKIKVKNKERNEKHCSIAEHKIEQDNSTAEEIDFAADETEMVLEPSDVLGDVSDVSDSIDCVLSEGRLENSANWDTDTCERRSISSGIRELSGLVNDKEGRSPSTVDDSSSSCSSDYVPSVVVNVSNRSDSASHPINQKSSSRGGNNQRANRVREETVQPSEAAVAVQSSDASQSSKLNESLSRLALQDRVVNGNARHLGKKEEAGSTKRNFDSKNDVYVDHSRDKSTCISPPKSPWKSIQSTKSDPPVNAKSSSSFDSTKQGRRLVSVKTSAPMQTDSQKLSTPIPTEKPSVQPPINFKSRPSSAPLVVPMVQPGPSLARSASAVGRLGSIHETTSYAPMQQSYRNAIMGAHVNHHSLPYSSQAPVTIVSAPLLSPIQPSPSFEMVNQQHETLQNGHLWMENQRSSRNFLDDMPHRDLYTNNNPVLNSRLQSGHQAHVSATGPADEFPHLDIINDLLDDDIINDYRNFSNGPQHWAQVYHDGSQLHDYVSVNPCGISYDTAIGPYMNVQSDVFVPNQWQMSASESSFLGHGNTTTYNVDGYLYHHQPSISEYPNPTVGVNAYSVFRPSNGL